MADDLTKLTVADPDDIKHALAFALKYKGRKRDHTGDDLMAQITAERLVEYLSSAGYVVMKKPPAVAHSDPGNYAKRLTD